MRPKFRPSHIVAMVLVIALVAAACNDDDDAGTTTAATQATTTTAAETTTTAAPTTTVPDDGPSMEIEIPFLDRWQESGHNDTEAEAFTHWNEDDPQVVPASCAKCHSTPGHLDFLGVDGSAFGSVEADHPVGTTVQCSACHNDVTISLTSVVMPSGIELTGLGDESRCMNCHQGRESGVSVAAMVEGLEPDTVSEDVRFLNIHYYAAAASKYGTAAKGGFEYPGQTYDAFFQHIPGYTTCIECHDPHTLELKIDECTACHTNVSEVDDLKDVRMPGSLQDYDGDGDLSEGIYYEIEGLQGLLYVAMERYSEEFSGAKIVYNPDAYPYFFDEAGERFAAWTPRLAQAAYNYQFSLKDPGGFAHGGKYIIQLLVDSTADLNSVLGDPVDISATHRIDFGHFAGSEEAFRHWDGEEDGGIVPGSCSRCHSDRGLPLYLNEGVTIGQPAANGFLCTTCHNDTATWSRYEAASVEFPSGATADLGDPQGANLCITCHQGRESGASVNALIGDLPDDEVSDSLRFLNIHYFAAGATLLGTEVGGGYEYDGLTYAGRRVHVEAFDTCTECHNAHSLQVEIESCGACHGGVETREDLYTIRMQPTDFDGDGDVSEGIKGEIDHMREALLAAMQDYANNTDGVTAIVYDAHSYPYFFNDLNGDGVATPDEANYGERYVTWTPRLLRAAYNYQYAAKDPGGFAHNPVYVLELLYDSIADIGGDVTGLTRP